MPHHDPDATDGLTESEAKANVAAHEKAHGHVAEPPHGARVDHDVPHDREGDLGPPSWSKAGRGAPEGFRWDDGAIVPE